MTKKLMSNDKVDDNIFAIIIQTLKNKDWADIDSIHKQIDFEKITEEFLGDRIHSLITDGKFINKINCNADSYYVNKKINTESLNLQNTSSIIPDKSFYTPTIIMKTL